MIPTTATIDALMSRGLST